VLEQKRAKGILGARAWAGPNKTQSLKRALAPRKSTEEKSSLDERWKPEMLLCGQLKNRAAQSRLKPGGKTLGESCAHKRETLAERKTSGAHPMTQAEKIRADRALCANQEKKKKK
jgi:hypothetical protein